MIHQKELMDTIQELLQAQHFAVLATQGDGYPYCTLVGFTHRNAIKEIIFSTIRNTHKYNNLKKHPQVSLLIDNQSNQANDIKDACALTVLGVCEELAEHDKDAVQTLFLEKHPYMENFVSAPDCAFIRILVKKYILVKNLQEVFELSFS